MSITNFATSFVSLKSQNLNKISFSTFFSKKLPVFALLYYLYSMRNFIFYFIFIITLCFVFDSCMQNISCPVEEELEITLPEWPPKDSFEGKYPPLSRWLIKIISAENSRQIYTSEKNFTIHIKKNRPMCLTAYPITLLQDGNECRYFKPAGFIYPAQNDILSKKPSASWEQGFLADIMQQLFKEGIEENLPPVDVEYLISTFNWKKAQESIEKKINSDIQVFYNPWLLSRVNILEGIISQNFKATFFNLKGATAIEDSYISYQTATESIIFLSSFIPENKLLEEKKQFTVMKNTPILISDAQKYGLYITYKSSKNISLEYIIMPIYIGDI